MSMAGVFCVFLGYYVGVVRWSKTDDWLTQTWLKLWLKLWLRLRLKFDSNFDASNFDSLKQTCQSAGVAREGNETKIFTGTPRKTSSLPTFCLLSVDGMLLAGREARILRQETSRSWQARGQQMGRVMFTSVRIGQCSKTEYHQCLHHVPVYERKPSPITTQNQYPL